jgi:phosphoribulokinase
VPSRRLSYSGLADAVAAEILKEEAGLRMPFLLAFGGEGNCRKTSVARLICQMLGNNGLTSAVIELDDYAYDRRLRLESRFSGYDPRSFDLHAFHSDLGRLISGQSIIRPIYDHRYGISCSGCSLESHSHELTSAPIIIAVGVYLDQLLDQAEIIPDISVFFRRVGISRFSSRIRRDVGERGYTMRDAVINYRRMRHDYRTFMRPALSYYSHLCSVGSRVYTLYTGGS